MTPRQKWIAALRSGEYQQCQGRLTDGKGYCCLGVACELFREEHPEQLQKRDGFYADLMMHYEELPPHQVVAWLGLRHMRGEYEINGETIGKRQLTELNDAYGYSFDQIADIIESNPPGLFVDQQGETR